MALHSLQQYRKYRTIQRMVQAQGQKDRASTREKGASTFDQQAQCRRKDRKIEQAQGRKKQAPSINRHSAGARIGRQSKHKGERSKHHRSIGIVQAQGQKDGASAKEKEASTFYQKAWHKRKDRNINKHGTSAKTKGASTFEKLAR